MSRLITSECHSSSHDEVHPMLNYIHACLTPRSHQAHHIRLLIFEVNTIGQWRNVTLQSIVEQLDGYGYSCYYAGRPTTARLTGCWSPLYEEKSWSTVLCAPRGDINGDEPSFGRNLEAASFLEVLWPHAERVAV